MTMATVTDGHACHEWQHLSRMANSCGNTKYQLASVTWQPLAIQLLGTIAIVASAQYSALWESLTCHPTIWIFWLYHFLTDDMKGNVLTGVTFDPFVTQKCNGTQTGSSINQKLIPSIRL